MFRLLIVAVAVLVVEGINTVSNPVKPELPLNDSDASSESEVAKPGLTSIHSVASASSDRTYYLPPPHNPPQIKCWTDWFDRDNPTTTGDFETLYSLRRENPGKICDKPVDIEFQTLSGHTKNVIYRNDVITGFICRNSDQGQYKKCKDYRVRFSCDPPFCGGGVCWTEWYNRDTPRGTGDWELLKHLRRENPGQICETPLYIEVVTTDTLTPAHSTGQTFKVYNPTKGFACQNEKQKYQNCRAMGVLVNTEL